MGLYWMAKKYSSEADYSPWQFKDDQPQASSSAKTIDVNFSQAEYEVKWQYDFSDNSYFRFLAGLPQKNKDSGKQVKAKAIAVQFVKTFPTKTDTLLSIGMDLNSGGKAEVFEDGQVIVGRWLKADGRTRYYDSQGREIAFDRGQIWVELVPEGQGVAWQ